MPESTYFGKNRTLQAPALERHDFQALDGETGLRLHRCRAGDKGPLILAPGTAMSGLSFCIDTVDQNLVEYLADRGYDLWLFDWRTSPELPSHTRKYTLDQVARYDWPAAVQHVLGATGSDQVQVFSHCLSSTCFSLALLRGYQPKEEIRTFVASQVSLHLQLNRAHSVKTSLRLDTFIPSSSMVHFEDGTVTGGWADRVIGALAAVIPKTYKCSNRACHRHSAMFGDLLWHSQINEPTHELVDELVPDCNFAFIADACDHIRAGSVMEKEDRGHLDRLALPITFLSGEHNNMFIPRCTEETYELLRSENDGGFYDRVVIEDYGHLDCIVGQRAARDVFPLVLDALRDRT